MAPNVSNAQKIALLREMFERRTQLFSGFGGQRTAQTIAEEWESLWSWCASNGYPFCKGARGWDYFRHATWANWKKLAIERHDKAMNTGNGAYEPTLVDELILQIIGKESPLVAELGNKREGEEVPTPFRPNKRGIPRALAHSLNGSTNSIARELTPPHQLNGLVIYPPPASTKQPCRASLVLNGESQKQRMHRARTVGKRAQVTTRVDEPKPAKVRVYEIECQKKLLEVRLLENQLGFPPSHTFAHELNGINRASGSASASGAALKGSTGSVAPAMLNGSHRSQLVDYDDDEEEGEDKENSDGWIDDV